jgi:hypothetical protein
MPLYLVGLSEVVRSKDFPAEEVVSNTVRTEGARSGNKVVRSENIGVASPDRITSG